MESYSENYRNLNPVERAYTFERQTAALNYISTANPRRILEVGCGLKSIREFGSEEFWGDKELVIVEPVDPFYQESCSKYSDLNSISLFHSTLEGFSAANPGAIFDFIIVNSVLQEVEDLATFLSCLKKLLDATGETWINVPNSLSLHRVIVDSSQADLDYQKTAYGRKHYFNSDSLIRLMRANGFDLKVGKSRILKPMADFQIVELLLDSNSGRQLWETWLRYSDQENLFLGAELDLVFKKSLSVDSE